MTGTGRIRYVQKQRRTAADRFMDRIGGGGLGCCGLSDSGGDDKNKTEGKWNDLPAEILLSLLLLQISEQP